MQADLFGAEVIAYDPQAARAFQADLARVLSRRTDPQTSKDAGERAKVFGSQDARDILQCLREHGPMGKDQIARKLGWQGVKVARRMSDLHGRVKGVQLPGDWPVRDSGRKAMSDAGHPEIEWEVAEHG